MFAKELRRGHPSNQQQLQPKSTTTTTMSTSSANFCFDGKELTLNCLTYQICDLTYPPLAQIVNNPSNVKTYVTVSTKSIVNNARSSHTTFFC